MKIFITKYALTDGIIEKEAMNVDDSNMMEVIGGGDRFNWYAHTGEYSLTRKEAVKRAEEMRLKKIASLKKQIAKLENLTFR